MEDDRAETNLGASVNVELAISGECKPKQPKKRFVGRKTAEKTERANGGLNGTIEDSGALQGMQESSLAIEDLC
jgi:2-(3-amino-3-carboxypropyl)histidine synthase